MNLNELARRITMYEGGEIEVNIAQVKDVLRSLGSIMLDMQTADALKMIAKLIEVSSK